MGRARRKSSRQSADHFTKRLPRIQLGDESAHRSRTERHVNVAEIGSYAEALARFLVERDDLIGKSELHEEWTGTFDRSRVCEKDRSRAECAHARRLGAGLLGQRIVSTHEEAKDKLRLSSA